MSALTELLSATGQKWLGIGFCLSQSAMFSGLNLAFFSVGRLRLEAAAESGDKAAERVLRLRNDANFLLCTILWGNVSVNVLLALLSESVLAGVGAFVFSTVGITLFGEILPQAYFSRHALRVGALLAPVVSLYRVLLFPVAKPTAMVLDAWIGKEGPTYLRERDLEIILQKHILEQDSEIGATEGRGALNFLDLDDRLIAEEGVEIAPETVFKFAAKLDLPMIPGPTDACEAFWKSADLTDQKIVFSRPSAGCMAEAITNISFIRLVPLSRTERNHAERDRERSDTRRLIANYDSNQHSMWAYGTQQEMMDEFQSLAGSDFKMVSPVARGAVYVSVGKEPNGVPDEVMYYGKGTEGFVEIVDGQLALWREA